jgi:hypothetical protein
MARCEDGSPRWKKSAQISRGMIETSVRSPRNLREISSSCSLRYSSMQRSRFSIMSSSYLKPFRSAFDSSADYGLKWQGGPSATRSHTRFFGEGNAVFCPER